MRTALCCALATVLALPGCVAPGMSPSLAEINAIRKIAVDAVEPPPLVVTDALPASSAGLEIIGTAAPAANVLPGGPALVLVGGVVMLVVLIASGQPLLPVNIADRLTQGLVWSPTRELADEVVTQLRSTGNARVVSASADYRKLDIENRDVTYFMENWLRPIRAWYSADTGDVAATRELSPNTAVLEVGLLNYEWRGPRFVVQVMMRLVDADTGRVIGRTRHAAYPAIGRATELLANDSARLKAEFVTIARPLVAAGLKDLGLAR